MLLGIGLLTGCGTRASDAALCDGTRGARVDHAAALVEDGGARSLVTGAHLIRLIDAGCRG
jgi:hypothetical protein